MTKKNSRILIAVCIVTIIAVAAVIGIPRYTASRKAAETRLSVDLSAPLKDGYKDDLIILPVSSDWAVVSATNFAKIDDPQPTRIYGLNLKTGELSSKFVATGRLSATGTAALHDGTTCLREQSGDKSGLIFVNPKSLAVTRQDLPAGLDIMNLAISPDRSKVAYTLSAGTYIAKADFSEARCVLPRIVGEKADDDMDDELDRVSNWSADGKQIVCCRSGYEWIVGMTICNAADGSSRFFKLPDQIGYLTTDNRLLVTGVYAQEQPEAGFGDLDLNDAAPAYHEIVRPGRGMETIRFGLDGKYAAIHSSDPQQATILSAQNGQTVATLTPPAGTTFDGITLTPADDTAIFVLRTQDDNRQPSLYIWRFLSEVTK